VAGRGSGRWVRRWLPVAAAPVSIWSCESTSEPYDRRPQPAANDQGRVAEDAHHSFLDDQSQII
jgi:hypothetical protein